MPFTLKIRPKAEKELDKLENVDKAKVFVVFDYIRQDPFSGKKLHGKYSGQYSIYAWPFRILYEIKKHELIILILKIKHRKDAYK
jgi:mRNA interferase RelE/StbE